MMVFFETMRQGVRTNSQSQQYHAYFKNRVMNYISAKYRKATEKQGQYRTMNGACH